jgi:glycosyltransferase involved in cell wall biosynthesis
LRKFYPDAQDGAAKRKELGLCDKFVLCNLGRFSRGKNHIFMLNILSSALKLNPSCVLLLAGSGPLEEKIKKIAAARGIAKNIIFLGPRTDVPSLYRAADAFIMPSLHEGFGLSAVEAQACGTRCFVSEFVPPEVRAANIKVLPLSKGAEFWAEEILRQFKCVNPAEFLKNAGLDAAAAALRWERIYTDCI